MGIQSYVSVTRRRFLRAGSVALFVAGIGRRALAADNDLSVNIGSTRVIIRITGGGGGLTYFAPHQNETTAPQAALAVMRSRGGTLIQLIHGGGRYISFVLGGQTYTFDPNRIFTSRGAAASLASFRRSSPEALAAVSSFAQTVLGQLASHRNGAYIGVHNNAGGAYSIDSYRPGGADAAEASKVYRNPKMDKGDFCFTDQQPVFQNLAAKQYSVALQSLQPHDDGSLSVYCWQNGIGYTNVEARQGHFAMQVEMIRAIG